MWKWWKKKKSHSEWPVHMFPWAQCLTAAVQPVSERWETMVLDLIISSQVWISWHVVRCEEEGWRRKGWLLIWHISSELLKNSHSPTHMCTACCYVWPNNVLNPGPNKRMLTHDLLVSSSFELSGEKGCQYHMNKAISQSWSPLSPKPCSSRSTVVIHETNHIVNSHKKGAWKEDSFTHDLLDPPIFDFPSSMSTYRHCQR